MPTHRVRRRLGLLLATVASATFAIAEGCSLEQGGIGPADLTPRDATVEGAAVDAARESATDVVVPDAEVDASDDADAARQPCLIPATDGGTTFVDQAPFQSFDGGMFGCSGKVSFANRAQLCNAAIGCAPCDVDRWRAIAQGAAPTHQYWTDDELRITARNDIVCFATQDPTGSVCPVAGQPFRVCMDGTGIADAGSRASLDPSGNLCNWSQCGYRDASLPAVTDGGDGGGVGPVVNLHFGGCSGGPTAGTLCCCP